MKVVILAGGKGSRLSEETVIKPKPLVEVGGVPIIIHIMNLYSSFGYNDFIIAAGYKGELIKDYFINYLNQLNNIKIDFVSQKITYSDNPYLTKPNWTVQIIDTGQDTLTGGRVLRLKDLLKNEDMFALTYGDGLSNIDIRELQKFHMSHKKLATISAVRPPGRFGALKINSTHVDEFIEKPLGDGSYINGGFFIFNPQIFSYLKDDFSVLELDPLQNLAKDGQLEAFIHDGFWQCMDTMRDKKLLDDYWATGHAPWVI